MSDRVQEYKRQKTIKENRLPLMYIVFSDRKGVSEVRVKQVTELKKANRKGWRSSGEEFTISDYKLEPVTEDVKQYPPIKNDYPYEVGIVDGEISYEDRGISSGFGDLWQWTYYCSLDKEDVEKYREKEIEIINKKYLNKEV